MRQDYKHMHRSNWPAKPVSKHGSLLENLVGGIGIALFLMGILYYAFIQATGGF